jgi:pimeloyl-ACP methyl ester carboxylesterase
MGGYVALSLARTHPSDLAGLALVDTRAGAEDEAGKGKRMESIALLRREGTAALVDQMLPNLLAEASVRGDPALRQRVRDMMLSVPAQTIEQALLAMRDRADQSRMLVSLEVPLALVVGAEDRITPVSAAREMAGSRAASLTIIPAAGHLTPVEEPAAVAEALLTLQRGGAGRAGGFAPSDGRVA